MAITTYGELKTAVANFLSRSDLSARIPEFVAMAEGWIAHGLDMGALRVEPLRIRAMEATADITIAAQTAALPARFLGRRRFYLDSAPRSVLEYYAPEQFWDVFADATSGQPRGFTVEGDSFVF